MRVLLVLLALLTTTAATAEPDDLLEAIARDLALAEADCGEPGVLPEVDCVRQKVNEVCSHWRECTGVCESFVPGFGEIIAPYYDPRHSVVRGSMLAVEPMASGTILGVIDYRIHLGLSFNVDC
ncbi:MAG: hypothetical protein QOD77_312 [Thermoplasmata archaeon]|nr:hypothetical protein [Thermoplasmata archaeon]